MPRSITFATFLLSVAILVSDPLSAQSAPDTTNEACASVTRRDGQSPEQLCLPVRHRPVDTVPEADTHIRGRTAPAPVAFVGPMAPTWKPTSQATPAAVRRTALAIIGPRPASLARIDAQIAQFLRRAQALRDSADAAAAASPTEPSSSGSSAGAQGQPDWNTTPTPYLPSTQTSGVHPTASASHLHSGAKVPPMPAPASGTAHEEIMLAPRPTRDRAVRAPASSETVNSPTSTPPLPQVLEPKSPEPDLHPAPVPPKAGAYPLAESGLQLDAVAAHMDELSQRLHAISQDAMGASLTPAQQRAVWNAVTDLISDLDRIRRAAGDGGER